MVATLYLHKPLNTDLFVTKTLLNIPCVFGGTWSNCADCEHPNRISRKMFGFLAHQINQQSLVFVEER